MNKTGTQILQTERLILRPFTPEDAEGMYRNWASDPEVTRYLTWPAHSSADVTQMLLRDWVSRYENGDYFNWAIGWKENGQIIGNISVVNMIEETTFTLEQMYRFEEMLAIKHPDNHHVKDKIRQQLQMLRDNGIIEFIGRGHYRKI